MSIGFPPRVPRHLALLGALLLAVAVAVGGCSDGDDGATDASGSSGAAATTLRLGYFPNVTHAPAVIGVQDRIFEDALGDAVDLDLVTFSTGTEAIEALFSDAIDATFIGPNPAINGFAQSDGEALRIVAGTTSGGASLVVSPDIEAPEDLVGTTLSTPSLGNTQDVALRAWLADQGLSADTAGGGEVSIKPQENADTLTTFQDGTIDGAWVPEPWATRLVLEGGGQRLVDESELWPDGEFVTTHLVVSTSYLDANPAVIEALIDGLLDSIDVANDDPAAAQKKVNDGIEAATTKRIGDETIAESWNYLSFTPDPIAPSLEESKNDAVEVGLLEDVDLDGIYDLGILNAVLAERGLEPVEEP